jgi:hypothetical protein
LVDIVQFTTLCRLRDGCRDSEPVCALRRQVAPERLRGHPALRREARRAWQCKPRLARCKALHAAYANGLPRKATEGL